MGNVWKTGILMAALTSLLILEGNLRGRLISYTGGEHAKSKGCNGKRCYNN